MGLHTTVARDGREAVELAARSDYDAIFMDCQMPNVDGYEATRQIRRAEKDRRVPIIAMTAYALDGDREHSLEAGMDDHIAKPLERTDVEAVVARFLRPRGDEQPQDAAPSGDHDDRADGDGLVAAGDDGVLDQAGIRGLRATLTPQQRLTLVDTFDQQSATSIAALRDAVRTRDHDEVRRVTHTLKGSSASLGATALARSCQRLSDGIGTDDPEFNTAQISALSAAGTEAVAALRRQLVG
jgi:CheY-like chemotaxis protein